MPSATFAVADPEVTGFDDTDWTNEYKALSRAFYDVARTGGTIVINQNLTFGEDVSDGYIGEFDQNTGCITVVAVKR